MKKIALLFVFIIFSLTSCKFKTKTNYDFIKSEFEKHSSNIKKVEYYMHRIDTFANRKKIWDNTGYALIERNVADKNFGFSFYGKRNDITEEFLYDNDYGFVIYWKDKKYKIEHPMTIIGSPGGQMVLQQIFYLDSVYKNVIVTEEDNKYILDYSFENDTVYNVTNYRKSIELTKNNYFPIKVKVSYNMLGDKIVTQYELKEVKINSADTKSIKSIKDDLKDFEVIQPMNKKRGSLLNRKYPKINLPNLQNKNEYFNLKITKVTLIDFWEVWCGWCIKSFPKIETLKNKYADSLQIIGIVTQNIENAQNLIQKKKITITNLIGNKELLKNYKVSSYPRYFLIDKNGIIRKEYFGYSDNIEKDIKILIKE